MLGFLASRGEFNPSPETRLDRSEPLGNRVLSKYKKDRESLWHRHQKGAERVPPPASVSNGVIYSPVSYYNESKECPEVAKILLDPLPQITFQDNRTSQKALRKEKLSSSRIHCCCIILNIESKPSCYLCNHLFQA